MKTLKTAAMLLTCAIGIWSALQSHAEQPDTQPEINQELLDSLAAFYDTLDEVTVTALKDIVKTDGSKLTYDLDQDQSSKGQSLLEALKKVPMVSVDGDDKIYIKGQSNFKINVNGREDPMLTANASTILKAMPAEAASKIEVINEPGAKYDAEGVAGILNIVTERKQSKDGYTGNLSLSGGSDMGSASAYARVKHNRLTADAGIDFTTALAPTHGIMLQRSQSKVSDTDWLQTTEMDQRFKFNYLGARFNLSWDVSDNDLFTLGANLTDMDARITQLNTLTTMVSRPGDLQWAYSQNARGNMKNFGTSANASYKHLFSNPDHNMIAAYSYNFGRNTIALDYDNSDVYRYPLLPEAESNRNINYTREHTATLDYTNPFGSGKHTLEAGAKGIFRHNTADSKQSAGPAWDLLSPINASLTRQLQDIYAAYAIYTGVFGPATLKGGVRYEHTYMGMDFLRDSEMPDFRRHLNDWVPSASATYSFDPVTTLRLGYQMRISRPNIDQVNPFEFRILQNHVQKGNPNLNSERYNSLSLTFSKFSRLLGGSIGLDASQSNNTIEEWEYWEDNTNIRTYGNLGRRSQIGLNGFINWNLTPRMSFNIYAEGHYSYIKSHALGIANHGWNCNYNASYSYTGPWDIRYNLYGGQNTGDITLQGAWHGYYYYGLSLSKGFLKEKKLTVTLGAQNFLQKYAKFNRDNETDTHITHSLNRQRTWRVNLTVGWTFGKLQDRVKDTGASLKNDDAKKTSSGSGSGIGM